MSLGRTSLSMLSPTNLYVVIEVGVGKQNILSRDESVLVISENEGDDELEDSAVLLCCGDGERDELSSEFSSKPSWEDAWLVDWTWLT